MGFSVSATTAIVFIGLFISFGMFYSATWNGFEEVSDARSAATELTLDRQNTALAVTHAAYDAGNDTLNVTVVNDGSTTLSVTDTDLLVDNELQTAFVKRTAGGDAETEIWLPGERLVLEVSLASAPTRVKVVTAGGVAVTEVL